MLNEKDRILFENQLINGLLLYENFFLKIYDFNPNLEDLFLNNENREIYLTVIEYFVERGYPTAPEIFSQLILKNAKEEVKRHFRSGPTQTEGTTDFNIALRLLEDSIEKRTRRVIEETDKKKLVGIEYAETIREEIDKVLLEKFNCYRKDNRTNEQKVYDLLATIKRTREGKTSDYIPTGFSKLDEALIGLPKGHLTTIASRPGMGKTSLMLKLKRNMVKQGIKPLLISIEMSSDQLLVKDLSAYSKINSLKIESGEITETENNALTQATRSLCEENYFIEDDGHWTIEKVKATIRKYLISKKIDIVFVDYLTQIHTPFRKDRFDLAVGEMTNSLREFAKETGLPVVILSQLNRECEKRPDKKPILSDLKESSSIEQDSKTVLFLYRPSYYGLDVPATRSSLRNKSGKAVENDNYAEILIAKARSGKTGTIPVVYQPAIHDFEDLVRMTEGNRPPFEHKSIKSYYDNRENEISL
jgi:replicative DNA helicase